MSGASGVQGCISAEILKQFMSAAIHILNLCIVDACSSPSIRNMCSAITETAK